MSYHGSKTATFNAIVIRTSASALLVEIDGDEVWIPYSQIAPESEIGEDSSAGDAGEIVMSEWIAKEKSLA